MFFRIPLELRIQIYSYLLISPKTICDAHTLVEARREARGFFAVFQWPVTQDGLHASVLYTCRAIYLEALPIHYKCNTFHFRDKHSIWKFEKLRRSKHSITKIFEPAGRLSLIENLEIEVGADGWVWGSRTKQRQLIDDEWKAFNSGDSAPTVFPNLRVLTLDFSSWRFFSADGSAEIAPSIRRYQQFRKGGVEKLIIRGIQNEITLDKLRKELLKKDGVLVKDPYTRPLPWAEYEGLF